jgi:hypothetical protein
MAVTDPLDQELEDIELRLRSAGRGATCRSVEAILAQAAGRKALDRGSPLPAVKVAEQGIPKKPKLRGNRRDLRP